MSLETHYDVSLMRISSVRLRTLSGRVTVEESISCFYTVARYGAYGARRKRDVSQVHGGGGLSEARARGSRELFVLVVSIARLRLRISFMRLADEEKKEEPLVRVVLVR